MWQYMYIDFQSRCIVGYVQVVCWILVSYKMDIVTVQAPTGLNNSTQQPQVLFDNKQNVVRH